MDIEKIKELIKILEDSNLNRLVLKDQEGGEIHLEKAPAQSVVSHSVQQPQPLASAQTPQENNKESKPSEDQPGDYITSPLVGTFYMSSSPQDQPFVKVGDLVTEGTVVCIIEAMKVMNEVKAGKSGRIAELCIENGHPVEFGTKLFKIT